MKFFKYNSFLTLVSGFSLAMAFCLSSCGDDDGPDYTPPTATTLTAPTGCTGDVESNGVSLSWNRVEAAEFYTVSRATSRYGEQISLGYIGDSGRVYNTHIVDTNPNEGDNYYFIRACNNAHGNSYSVGPESTPIYVYYQSANSSDDNNDDDSGKPSTPTGVKAVLNGSEIVVSWNASKNADFYLVRYTKPDSSQEFESFPEETSITYRFNPMPKGTYTFYVKAVSNSGGLLFSEDSETVSVYYAGGGNSGGGNSGGGNSGGDNSGGGNSGGGNSGETNPSKLETPTGLQVNSRPSDSFVQLQCNAVPLGYQYELYRSKSPNSGYSKINAYSGTNASGTTAFFTDSNPLTGTSYYKVKAIALPGLGISDSDFSNYVTVTR